MGKRETVRCEGARRRLVRGGLAAAGALVLAACVACGSRGGYTPGLGEIMTLNQMRHAKLWLAGTSRNWPLASYEVDELEEGFGDVMRYHPTHKDSPVPLTQVVPKMTAGPIKALREAIRRKDEEAFTHAFDSLTEACNSCHRLTNFGFNVVKRPSGNPFPNQEFTPQPEGD